MKINNFSHNTLFKIIITLSLLMVLLLAFRGVHGIIGHPFTEDGYYAMSIARNIASGNGLSCDGVQLTNGFQPLFVFAIVPCFWLAPDSVYEPMRYVYIFSFIIYLLAGIFAAKTAKYYAKLFEIDDKTAFWLTLCFYYSSILLFSQHFNGLETGMLLLWFFVCWSAFLRFDINKLSSNLLFGVLLGILILIRIDAAFLVLFYYLLNFYRAVFSCADNNSERSNQNRVIQATSFKRTKNIVYIILSSVICGFVISPWFLYNYFYFGSFVPSSGIAQMEFEISLQRSNLSVLALLRDLSVLPFNFQKIIPDKIEIIFYLIIIVLSVFIIRKLLSNSEIKEKFCSVKSDERNPLGFPLLILISSIMSVIWYTLFFTATHFYLRYFIPFAAPGIIFCVLFLTFLMNKYSNYILIFLVLFFAGFVVKMTALNYNILGNLPNTFYTEQYALVKKYVPETEYVSAGQSGTLGYFRNNVVNLDGKVNKEALANQSDIALYLEKKGIEWFCDWDYFADKFLKDKIAYSTSTDSASLKGKWQIIDSSGKFKIYKFNK